MTDCKPEILRTVPLYRVVAAAIVDTHEDIGKVEQVYSHWAARGLKKLEREVLKTTIRKVLLPINRNTNTATLPPDFEEETYVGLIINGKRVRLRPRANLVNADKIETIACENKCPRCDQDKAICEELTVTEDVELIDVNGIMSPKTVIKKLNPDGSYYLETTTPVWDIETEAVIYVTTKEYITTIDLKPCGCPEDTVENVEKIKCCCPDVYNSYYIPCDNSCDEKYGGYRILEGVGIIQLENVDADYLYMEYRGYLPKINGQYHVPEIAFETLVNYIKFKNVENRKSAPAWERLWTLEQYRRERGNMEKVQGRISLSAILSRIGITPRFDIDYINIQNGKD